MRTRELAIACCYLVLAFALAYLGQCAHGWSPAVQHTALTLAILALVVVIGWCVVTS